MINGLAPNDINMVFKTQHRLGTKAIIPQLNTNNSFGVKAARLWNLLPKEVLMRSATLKVALGHFIQQFPDTPPTKGYTAINHNSLLDWTSERSYSTRGRT